MTDKELAELKLAAWNALAGWGTTQMEKIRDMKIPTHIPLTFEQRCQKADKLVCWMLAQP